MSLRAIKRKSIDSERSFFNYIKIFMYPYCKLRCVVRRVVDTLLPHAESGPNDHRKDASPFTRMIDKEKNILITEFRARTFVNKDDIQLRVAFDQVDTDSSGSIDLDELFNAMRALGREMPMKQVQGIMDEYDTDKSGEIDFDEFKDMMEGLKNKNKLSDDRLLVCICRFFGPPISYHQYDIGRMI